MSTTRARRICLALTAVAAVLGAVGATLLPVASFRAVNFPVQVAMSVPLPFLGAGLGHDVRSRPTGPTAARTLRTAAGLGGLAAAYGLLVAAVTVAATGIGWAGLSWSIVAASVAVQVLALLTGTGFGMLVPRVWIAGLLTIVAPMAVYLLLAGRPAGPWLVPFLGAQNLLGPLPPDWVRWPVILLIWGVVLNLTGWLVARPGSGARR